MIILINIKRGDDTLTEKQVDDIYAHILKISRDAYDEQQHKIK